MGEETDFLDDVADGAAESDEVAVAGVLGPEEDFAGGGLEQRLTVRRRVVLPEPLRPRMAVVVPSSRVREMRSSRRWPSGSAKETLRKSMAGMEAGLVAEVVNSDLLVHSPDGARLKDNSGSDSTTLTTRSLIAIRLR